MTYIERIHNVETGETTDRPYTAKEIKEVEAAQLEAVNSATLLNEKESAKAALLQRLGITAEEAKLLLS